MGNLWEITSSQGYNAIGVSGIGDDGFPIWKWNRGGLSPHMERLDQVGEHS